MRALPAPPARLRSLGDAGCVALALAVILGSEVSRPLPLALGAGAASVALAIRRPWLLVVAAALLASALGARAEAGLHPVERAHVRQVVSLVSDPSPTFGGVRALVRVSGRRLEARAYGSAAGGLSVALAGERVLVDGTTGPAPGGDAWLHVHHVAGVLNVSAVERTGSGSAPWRAANQVRRLLERGAASLPPGPRALFNGFVLGDDRDEPVAVSDDFRGSGLAHLLAVSGENVAFVLSLLAPLVRRLGLGSRWAVTVGAIGFFALVTRGEPSVLRAATMAGLSVTAGTIGRPIAPIRLLALAVTALVLIDPFLVNSVGFQLSVAASLGLVLLAPSLRRSLPGPAPFAEALAVTLAAQVGVAPVVLATFGELPVAAVPANLLAVPVAGLVMVWGLGAGLVAGAAGGQVAAMLHLPTRLMIAWISGVAERAARWPLGDMRPADGVILLTGLLAVVIGGRASRSLLVKAGYTVVVLALAMPAVSVRLTPPPLRTEPVAGAVVWRAGGATVLELAGGVHPDRLLAALRQAGVRRLDLVVLSSGGSTTAAQVGAIRHHWPVADVLEPSGGTVPGASVPSIGWASIIGALSVDVVAVRPRLEVSVEPLIRSISRDGEPDRVACVLLELGPRRLDVTFRSVVVGILNRTPDSFYRRRAATSSSTRSCREPRR